jgi:hypothetical protein
MDCERARKLMPLISGSDVTEATRASVLAHAEACAACRAEWEAYRRAAEALASVREVPEPPGGWASIWAGVAEHLAPAGSEADVPGAARSPAPVLRVEPPAPVTWAVRGRRVAATLLVGFTVGFTAYHVAFRPDPAPVVTDPGGPFPRTVQASAGTGAPAALPAALRERIGLIDLHPQPGAGWRIRQIQPGSPAFRSGLQPDDVLKALDGAALPPSPEEFDTLAPRLLERNEIRIRILRGGTEQDVVVKLHDPAFPEKEKPVAPGPPENK